MFKVNVFVTNMSGERLWDVERDMPPQLQIAVNVNILNFEELSDGNLQVPFVFTVNFTPAIAQISIRGRARIQGEKAEIQKIFQQSKEQKPPPAQVIQAVANVGMAESILISRTIGVPPPLPPIPPPPSHVPAKGDTRYTA